MGMLCNHRVIQAGKHSMDPEDLLRETVPSFIQRTAMLWVDVWLAHLAL